MFESTAAPVSHNAPESVKFNDIYHIKLKLLNETDSDVALSLNLF